ncbi:MAG: hypothetical protein ACTSVU_08290 [Promethearchaeota archaeon]
MAGVSFAYFDLGNAISGSLFVNLGNAIEDGLQLATGNPSTGSLLTILIGGIIGLVALLMFPVHWLLYYRPDDPMMAIALTIPWVVAIGISAAIFAKSAKQGIFVGIILAIGYIIIGIVIYILLSAALVKTGGVGQGAVDGMFLGLTGLHPILAVILSSLEGALVGGSFGALIGALKYKPTEETYEPKQKKKKNKKGKKGDGDGDKLAGDEQADFVNMMNY